MSTSPRPNCPWRKPPKHAFDQSDKIAHVVGGALFGALASSLYVIERVFASLVFESGTLWLPAAVGGVSIAVCGILGGVIGPRFIEWMSEHWHEFYRYFSEFSRD